MYPLKFIFKLESNRAPKISTSDSLELAKQKGNFCHRLALYGLQTWRKDVFQIEIDASVCCNVTGDIFTGVASEDAVRCRLFLFWKVSVFCFEPLVVDSLQDVVRSGGHGNSHEVALFVRFISVLTEDGGPHFDDICDELGWFDSSLSVLNSLEESQKLDAISA